ncbi:MAG: ATP-binding protein [Clostridia bacterium]|nr:ATP-binding protein [Clostridia bacterium]
MIKREMYMSRIRPFIGNELIKVMTGIRRSGKSVMLELIKEELTKSGIQPSQFISINFEDLSYSHLLTATALNEEIIRRAKSINGKVHLFFDEIQEVDGWEKCVNSLRVALDCDIYITGSNAKLLSGELATYLAGRYVQFVIYPFSFSEFSELYHTVSPKDTQQQCFQKYLIAGGMPYLGNLRYDEEPSRQYLTDLFNSVQLKDIVKRNKVRDVDLLERIIAYAMANVGTKFSASSLVKFLKNEKRTVAAETVMNYMKYCCDAYLFYQVKREDLRGKQILASNEKYYIADHGIREAVFGGNMRDINLILENIVFMELLRRGYTITVGKSGEKEIDFVCDKRGEKLYIQVAYLLAGDDTIKREFSAFDDVRDNFPKYVVTLDEFDMSRNGIKHRNIRDFLTAKEWN